MVVRLIISEHGRHRNTRTYITNNGTALPHVTAMDAIYKLILVIKKDLYYNICFIELLINQRERYTPI